MRLYHMISMFRARMMGVIVLNRDEAWELSAARGPIKNQASLVFCLTQNLSWLASYRIG